MLPTSNKDLGILFFCLLIGFCQGCTGLNTSLIGNVRVKSLRGWGWWHFFCWPQKELRRSQKCCTVLLVDAVFSIAPCLNAQLLGKGEEFTWAFVFLLVLESCLCANAFYLVTLEIIKIIKVEKWRSLLLFLMWERTWK